MDEKELIKTCEELLIQRRAIKEQLKEISRALNIIIKNIK